MAIIANFAPNFTRLECPHCSYLNRRPQIATAMATNLECGVKDVFDDLNRLTIVTEPGRYTTYNPASRLVHTPRGVLKCKYTDRPEKKRE